MLRRIATALNKRSTSIKSLIDRFQYPGSTGLFGKVDALDIGKVGQLFTVSIGYHDGQCISAHHIFIGT